MASLKTAKLSASTVEQVEIVSTGESRRAFRSLLIKNQGSTDCLIQFDNVIDSDAYLLEAGEILSMEWPFGELHYKTNSGTTTLYLLKI